MASDGERGAEVADVGAAGVHDERPRRVVMDVEVRFACELDFAHLVPVSHCHSESTVGREQDARAVGEPYRIALPTVVANVCAADRLAYTRHSASSASKACRRREARQRLRPVVQMAASDERAQSSGAVFGSRVACCQWV